jgi:glycosyltransferase involved in cell wall biosynthesis
LIFQKLLEALKELRAEGKRYPLVGMLLDTGPLQGLDLKAEDGKAFLYGMIREFCLHIPPEFRAQLGARPQEGMAGGVPVAASLAPAIPEVAKDAAVYFRPDDPETMAEKILFLLESRQAREELIAKGKKRVLEFSWQKSAAETLEFYLSVVKE